MRVAVGLSGGVDSSVAALLLQQDGHSVECVFMRNWREDADDPHCHAEQDRKDAVAVAGRLGLRFHLRDFSADYLREVFRHFLDEYARGRTPNPDVLCNREIKFKVFLEAALALGAERIATGHYARVRETAHGHELLRGVDAGKDQSYFLHALGQYELSRTLFPLGVMHKPAVRALAREHALPTQAKKDSTGICFIGERDFRTFLAQYLPARPGDILDSAGRRVGEHPGSLYFTLGQRAGLGLGGVRGAGGGAWYVVGKDVAVNTLIVAQGDVARWLDARTLRALAPTWIAGHAPADAFTCQAQIRYRQPAQECHVEIDADGCRVRFARPQRAPAPGQSIVFYQDEVCLGGATIEASDAVFGGLIAPPPLHHEPAAMSSQQ
ncbi:tRNA 2-thiouridine(34) synthase MnmA [Metallibacterium sp.]